MKIAKLGGDKVGEGGYVRWRRMNMSKYIVSISNS